jgi:hypothetical protein
MDLIVQVLFQKLLWDTACLLQDQLGPAAGFIDDVNRVFTLVSLLNQIVQPAMGLHIPLMPN